MTMSQSRRQAFAYAQRLLAGPSLSNNAQKPLLLHVASLSSSSFPTIRPGRVRPRNFTSLRQYSSPSSNSFWRDLNLAVGEGDGEGAEEIVMGLLDSQYSLNNEDASKGDNGARQVATPKSLDTRIFSLVLEAWRNSESELAAERAQQLLDQMIALCEEGILREPPSVQDYHAVLECWAASGDTSLHAAESALRIAERMKQDNDVEMRSYELLLQILARGGHVASAEHFLESSIPEPHTIAMYNSILLSYLKSNIVEAPEKAHRLLRKMLGVNSGYPEPDVSTYDLVLQSWAQVPDHPDASTNAQYLLNEMKQKKKQPTLVSYQSVISILARHGEAIAAERLLAHLVQDYGNQFDAQLKPTLEPFQAVLLAYTNFHHADAAPRAESLLKHMHELYESGILERRPDAWSYNFVLKCWMHSRHRNATDRALKVIEKMRVDGVAPDISTMNTMLNIIAERGDPRKSEEFLNQMYQAYLEDPIRNPQPDVISFGTVLKAWANRKAPQSAERAQSLLLRLQNLHESGWSQCKPDTGIFASVIKCYSYSQSRDAPYRAEAILRSMQESTMKPDLACWNIAIQGWAQVGDGPRAEGLLKEMLEDYLANQDSAAAPNVITFSAVLSAWAKTQNDPQAAERAEMLLQQMKEICKAGTLPDAKPNVVSYSCVLDALAYAKSSAAALRAESILREMKASDDPDIQPNVVSYNSVIKAWSLSRDPNALFKVTTLLKEMISLMENDGVKSVAPNANTFGSVLKVLADSNVPDKEARAQVVVGLMDKFGIVWNDWSRNQLRRCSDKNERNARRNKTRRIKNAKTKTGIPEVSDLKYS